MNYSDFMSLAVKDNKVSRDEGLKILHSSKIDCSEAIITKKQYFALIQNVYTC